MLNYLVTTQKMAIASNSIYKLYELTCRQPNIPDENYRGHEFVEFVFNMPCNKV